MSLYGALDKTKHFGEFLEPLFTNSGVLAPATRQALARANLGVSSTGEATAATTAAINTAIAAGMQNARFAEQPLIFQAAPTAVNATATLTSASIIAGLITSTTAAAVAGTLPAPATFDAAMLVAYPQLANGDSIVFTIINTGAANAFTLTASGAFTIVGNAVIALSSSGTFQAVRTSSTAWVAYRI